MAYSDEIKEQAKTLFLRAYKPDEISQRLLIPERTIYNWIDSNGWRDLLAYETAEQAIARRICELSTRENKNKEETLELKVLCETFGGMQINLAKAAKIRAEAEAISRGEPDAVAAVEAKESRRQKRGKPKAAKNDISNIDLDVFDAWAEDNLFEYQLLWRAVCHDPELRRNRFILKSRQIGATYYFAFEAFEDAVKNGENQIFLSASKDQARVFKAYIIAFAREQFDLELKGADFIELYKDGKLHATLYFLSTNSNTAQSYHGHLYIDEVFWIPGYEKLQKVASGMAAHKKWRRTYFSTPSSLQHPAYQHWCGAQFNKGKPKAKQIEIDLKPATLKKGALGPDKVWRHLVTVEDAERMGCNLFDIVELKEEYSKSDFENLFGCKFIDDAESLFPFSTLQKCMVDSLQKWTHWNPDARWPVAKRPVAVGYDPSRIRDNAALVVLEIPLNGQQKWRLLEKHQFTGMSSEYQASRIRELYDRYNVVHVGIDTTGIGYGVFDLICDLPEVVPIHYSIETKTDLVTRGQRLIDGGRFEYDLADTETTQSLMMIHQQTTGNGHITYGANRNGQVGHADVAWAIFHGFLAERIQPESRQTPQSSSNTGTTLVIS